MDNISINTAGGMISAATDEISSVHHQLMKVEFGAEDSATQVAPDSGLPVSSARKEVTFSTTTAQAVATTDVSEYRWASVQVTNQGASSTVTFQGSNDNSTWVSVPMMSSTTTSTIVFSTTTTALYAGPVVYRYFRLNVTGIASGTTAGVIEFFAFPAPQLVTAVTADTELPSAATLSDTMSNPSTSSVAALPAGYNGSTWERQRTVTSADNTSGTGVPAAGLVGYDSVNTVYHRLTSSQRGTTNEKNALDVALPSRVDNSTLTVTAGSGTRTFGPIDALNYMWWTATFTSVGSGAGAMSLEMSHDNSTWVTPPYEVIDSSGNLSTSNGSTLWINAALGYTFTGPLQYQYIRIKTTGTVTGTYVLRMVFSSTALAKNILTVGGSTIGQDALLGSGNLLSTTSLNSGYNGATWDRLRVPTIFKTATATASGDTTVHTPASGKKFRLMRYQIQVTADAAMTSGGDLDIVLRDGTTGLAASYSVYAPAVAGASFANSANSGWVDLGNGQLSSAANNVLNINLSAALTSGKVRVVVALTEE